MHEIEGAIFSPLWWFSVIFVGLLVHLLAGYLRPQLDKVGGRVSRSWAELNRRTALAQRTRIEALRSSEKLRLKAERDEVRQRLQALLVIMLILFFFFMADALYNIAGPISKLDPTSRIFAKTILVIAYLIMTVGTWLVADSQLRAAKIKYELEEAEKEEEKGDFLRNL